MWVLLVVSTLIAIGSAIATYALAPKPTKPKAASLADINAPTANEGIPVPVPFGTVRMSGPNVVWFGDLHYEPIKTYVL